MSLQPTIEICDNYLLVTHPPTKAGNTEAQNFAAELADVCDRENIHRVLLDEQKITYTVDNIFDLMGIGDKLLKDMLVFRFHRLACVPGKEQLQIAKDFESVARNRGMNYRVFEKLEDAKNWLLKE